MNLQQSLETGKVKLERLSVSAINVDPRKTLIRFGEELSSLTPLRVTIANNGRVVYGMRKVDILIATASKVTTLGRAEYRLAWKEEFHVALCYSKFRLEAKNTTEFEILLEDMIQFAVTNQLITLSK